MERLTEKRDGQNVIPLRQNGKVKWSICSAGLGDAPTEYLYGEHADRLAAIEDILGDEYDLDRLRELVEADKTLKEFAEDVARQFGYHGTTADGRPAYTCGGLSTLEWAWNILDWPDPKPAPECECQEEGCREWATGGRPTPDGYKCLCGRHFAAYEARGEAMAALRREQDG